MAISGHKGVSRIDQDAKNHHGWYVRVRFNGKSLSKFFRDSAFGSRKQSLTAAVAYRDEAERELGRPRTDRTVLVMSSRNSSGVVGVRRRERKRTSTAGMFTAAAYYEACWSPVPGELKRKLFSVDKLGERGAFLAACAHRRDMERALLGSEIRENWAAAAPAILAAVNPPVPKRAVGRTSRRSTR